MRAHLCGVPTGECQGSMRNMSSGMRMVVKAHSTPEEAFRCHAHQLISKGWERKSMREFINPENGAIRLLTKPSRFGGVMRGGKKEKTAKTKRLVPGKGGGVVSSL